MPNPLNQLLRRTFLAAVAIAAGAAVLPTQAQKVTRTEDGSTICATYTSAQLTPNAGLTITGCTTTAPVSGPAGAFDFQVNTGTYPNGGLVLNQSYTNALSIVRSGGTSGSVTVNFTRSGGCGPLPLQDSAVLASGATSVYVPVKTPNNNATCKYTMTAVTGDGTATSAPTVGTTLPVATMTVSATGTPPGGTNTGGNGGGTTSGCATPDPQGAVMTVNPYGVDRFTSKSGVINWSPLPTLAQLQAVLGTTATSAAVKFADATNTPSTATKEIWISKCPGVFDSNVDTAVGSGPPGKCYVTDPLTGDATVLTWFAAPGADPATTDTRADYYGACEAYDANGPWYINFRWTYNSTACPWGGDGGCGFTGQWNSTGIKP